MSTINSLLKSVAPAPAQPDPSVVEGDLARGRAAQGAHGDVVACGRARRR
jgi:hypothetical protein